MAPTPRALALARAAELAAEAGERSRDTRLQIEAEIIKRQLGRVLINRDW